MSQVLKQWRYRATLFDGISTTADVESTFDTGDVYNEFRATEEAARGVATEFTDSGMPYDGWTLQAMWFWPVVVYIP